MDTDDAPLAPPVVAVVVVHAPGPWFDETLESLADQDYPNLNALFILSGPTDADGADLGAAIHEQLPDAFVHEVGDNPGFGALANEVLRLVEGDRGFFCFLHDDVALDPDAIRRMVEELYRSNAGAVGPKLVEWDAPGVLQHVGLGLDRFADVDEVIEPGEFDQEQHDAVRDVFVVPSACVLVRADLFRAVGGFDPAISFHGDDVDLCWRIHLSGARVVVAPQARVRHLEQLEARRPDLNHGALRARHRLRSLVTLTTGGRLLARSIELIGITIAQLAVGLFTGRIGDAWASLRSLIGLIPRSPGLMARRRALRPLRQVDDAEIARLHVKGSARLASYLRSRDTATYVGEEMSVRRWRESSLATTLTWLVVVAGIVLAARTIINTRVPPVGEMLPLPDSPGDLWRTFLSGWNPNGLGGTAAVPTGWAALSLGSVLWAFHSGLGLTVLVVGGLLFGLLGMWRLAAVFPHNRSRIAALVVYAATPLVPGLISFGRLGGVIAYASVPWFVHLLRRALGIGTADPELGDLELVEAAIDPDPRDRVRRTAVLAILTAIAVALAPSLFVVLALVALVFALATLAAGVGVRATVWALGLGAAGLAGAFVLNLPWAAGWSSVDLLGPLGLPAPRRGLVDVAAMDIGVARLAALSIAWFLPVAAAVLVARSWRLTWAVRAAALVGVFGLLAVLQDRGALPFRLPEVGYLLVPVTVGLALGAASLVAAFTDDVAGRSFGWRQPLGLLGLVAIVVGAVPAVLTITDGAFYAPRSPLNDVTANYIGTDDEATAQSVGDSRILFVGDPRLLPVPGTPVGGGVSYAVVDDGPLDARDRWAAEDGDSRAALTGAVRSIAAGSSARGGRLLAPFGVRYVVVPLVDEVWSTGDEPLPAPVGLVPALTAQLDLVRKLTPNSFVVFENAATMPTVASATGALAEASRSDGLNAMVSVDPEPAEPLFVGVDESRHATGDVPAGAVLFATGADDRWQLTVAGEDIAPRTAFGATAAYDVGTAGRGELRYVPGTGRLLGVILMAAVWLIALVLASRVRLPAVRTRRSRDETLLDLDREPGAVDLAALDREDPAALGGWVEEMLAAPGAPRLGPAPGRGHQRRRVRRPRGADMILRRVPIVAALAVGAVAVATVGRSSDPVPEPVFSARAAVEPWMPAAPVVLGDGSTTWFCPGVPASGDEDTAGEVIIANADDVEITGEVTLLGIEGDPVVEPVSVGPRSRTTIDVGEAITSQYAGAVVELTGAPGVVEQRSTAPVAGGATAQSVAPCTTRTSPNWYLAEGYTAEGSTERLIIMNPYESDATVQVRFATQDGTREPAQLQGMAVPPHSVRVLDMAELAARDEPEVAVSILARAGEVVVARAQEYTGTGRRGFAITMAAPIPRDQWWFADGETAQGVTERYSIYNPGERSVEVTAALLGIDTSAFVPIEPIDVPAGRVVTFSPADVPDMPEGRHAMVFGTASLDARIVVERATSRIYDDLPTTSVNLGAVARFEDGYVATTWTLAYGVEEPTPDALVVYNVDANDATVTVQAVGDDGIVNVPGLEEVSLPANGLITIDLTDEEALGRQLVLRSTSRVFVERLLPRDEGAQGRVSSWPLPVAG